MRAHLAATVLALTLFSGSIAHSQVTIEVSKVTCDQFVNGKIGQPRMTAAWLSGYYHGKKGSTTIDTQDFEANLAEQTDFCRTGNNGKILVMRAIEQMLKKPK